MPNAPVSTRAVRDAAAAKAMSYGAAVTSAQLADATTPYAQAVAAECNLLVAEYEMKWDALRPSPTTFDFRAGDQIAAFAAAHGQALRGHCLVWHEALPSWFAATVTPANAERYLVDHVTAVCAHFRGRVQSWDVVNEAVDNGSGRADRLRVEPWLRLLPNYLETAFAAANAADPSALLVYNDYGLESDGSYQDTRRCAVLGLLDRLLAAGSSVGALGLQAHLDDASTFRSLPNFLREVAARGIRVLVTELDVSDALSTPTADRDARIADVYARLLDAVLDGAAPCDTVLTWGLCDRYSWLQTYNPRPDGVARRPLPLDAALARKPAQAALVAAFDRTAARR